MKSIHYYFDESGEKGFVKEGFDKTTIGLVAGIALPSIHVPEIERDLSDILSKLNTSNSNKIHSTELFENEDNRKIREKLLEYLSNTEEWLLIYEAVYPLGLYQNNKISTDLFDAYKPRSPRVKVSKNPQI